MGKRNGKRRSSAIDLPAPDAKKTKYDDNNNIFQTLETFAIHPEEFVEQSEELQTKLLRVLQQVYQYGKSLEPKKLSPLTKLVVDDLDTDQIWEQIQLFNKPLLKYVNTLPLEEALSSASEDESSDDDQINDHQLYDESSDSEDQEMIENNIQDGLESNSEEDEEVQSDGGEENENDEDEPLEDDPFFDLDEMEAFIEDGERRAELGSEGEDEELLEYLNQSDLSGSDSEGAGIDWERMKEGKEALKKKDIRFEDFYSEPEKLSKYQLKKKQLQDKIENLEETNIADKPWQLKGEVSSAARPKDSLLEEFVIFDHATKTAPTITVEKTEDLEDIIKRRIAEESWDDVLPQKSLEDDSNQKPLADLDHERSKHGLAEVYERQYLGLDKEEAQRQAEEKYGEISKIFNSLCYKLDSLSNFHYTPKKVQKATAEKQNVASINMEEVLPSSVSDASLLAPEEVYAPKKKPIKGDTEVTSEEKKARRRAAKTALRKQKRAEEADRKVVEKLNPGLGNKYTKQKAIDNLKQLRKSKNVQFADKSATGINYTQSTAFFSKLQQDAQSEITKVKETNKKKQSAATTDSAHSFKL